MASHKHSGSDLDLEQNPSAERALEDHSGPLSDEVRIISDQSGQPGLFEYQPLEQAGHIRLLVLTSETAVGTYNCAIKHIDMAQRPLYTAISYTWGSADDTGNILVDGKTLTVRSNVIEILKCLAKPSQPRRLWIDSICINQDDVKERNSQVRLMGDIFANASYVIAWLSPDNGPLLNKLQMIARVSLQESGYRSQEWKDVQELINQFFQHRYWTRRWIVQEVILARSVIMVTPRGSTGKIDQIPISFLSDFYENVRSLHFVYDKEMALLSKSLARELISSRARANSAQQTIRELLVTYKQTKCRDVRDKVFGLAALSPKAKDFLNIDYAADPVTILFTVLEFALQHENLHSHETVGLILELRAQLELSWSSVRHASNLLQDLSINVSELGRITLFCRGSVRSSRAELAGEALVHQYRDVSPSLLPLSTRLLHVNSSTSKSEFQCMTWSREQCKAISGQELCMFTFDGQAGLATCLVESGDEIWQFADTPVALLARREDHNHTVRPEGYYYQLCGRAFLFHRYRHESYDVTCSGGRDWLEVIDMGKGLGKSSAAMETRELNVDFNTLIDVLEWVGFDA